VKPRMRPRTYVAVISLAAVTASLGIQAVSPGLPEVQQALGLSISQLGWFTTAYVLPGVILTVPLGILGDSIGRRTLFCIALLVYGLAGLAQALVTAYPLFLSLRVLQGACFAVVMPLTITLIGDAFAGHERIRGLASRNAILTGSEVVLPLTGALLATLSWRAPFWFQVVNVPWAVYCFSVLEEHHGSFGGKRKYARDLLSVLRGQPGMFAVLVSSFSRFLFKFLIYAWLPILLVTNGNSSLTDVGILMAITYLVAAGTSTRVPVLLRAVPPSLAVIGSVLALALATAGFALVDGWPWALLVGVVYGIGDGVLAVLLDTYAIHTAQAHVRAGMVSISQTARNLGKLASPVVMTALVAVSSIHVAFGIMGAFGVAITPLLVPLRTMDGQLRPPGFDPRAEAAQATDVGEQALYE
jgi:MFS transporter, ACDE family, multidrug resistance protein